MKHLCTARDVKGVNALNTLEHNILDYHSTGFGPYEVCHE
jgi:hypothetical protein